MKYFMILLAEDEPETLVELRALLLEGLPDGSIVDTAGTVEEALQAILKRLNAGEAYDMAILDFKMPLRQGESPVVDESICARLFRSMPQAIVGHITSYVEDKQIISHLNSSHPPGRRQGFFLDKNHSSFGSDLIDAVERTLFNQSVEQDLNDVIRAIHGDGWEEPPSGEPAGSLTNRLADVAIDIATHWKFLSEATRAKVEDLYLVTIGDSGNIELTCK